MAWVARLGLLALCAAALAVTWSWGSRWAPFVPLLPPLLLLAGLGAVLAFEFLFVAALRARHAHVHPALRQVLAAWWFECWTTVRLIAWRVPFRGAGTARPMSQAAPTAMRGVVLVHGYGCNRGVWVAWLNALAARNIPSVAVNLVPAFASISAYSLIVESAVAELERQTGLAPVLVAHSMGGLAARDWWANDPSASRLHCLITIGTPHQGTRLAAFGWGANAKEMRAQSDWLLRLHARETPAHQRRTISFFSACDNVVFPSQAAMLPGSDNRELPGVGHVALVDHPEIFAAALHSLGRSD